MRNQGVLAQSSIAPSAPRLRWLQLGVAVFAVVLALIPLLPIRAYYIQVLVLFCFFAALATAWSIAGGFGGMISLGHAAFTGLGAYTSTLLLTRLDVNPWVGLVLGGLVAAAVACILGYPCFRFGLRADFFALATLVFGIIVYELINGLPTVTGGPHGVVIPFAGHNPFRFSFASRGHYFYVAWVYWLLTVWVAYRIQHSRFGLQLMALREDEPAAARAGIDVTKVKLLALMISAGLTGLAGTFYAQYFLFIEPTEIAGLGLSVEIIVVAIVGGLSSFLGGTLGALVLVPLTQLLNNGSGKTTLFDIISGFTRPTSGRIVFDGRDVTGELPFRIARAGVGRVFQLARIFRGMTVYQNLLVYAKPGTDVEKRVEEILRFLKLAHLAHQSAQGLSYGQQRLLELGCVLMMDPKLILLDEPAAGINPALLEDLMEHIRQLARQGKTIFIIEHNIPLVARLCQRVVVLDSGRLLAAGDPETVLNDARVREAYLGG